MRTAGRVLANAARGFAMGAADVVPGVSGGTVALLLGIYDRLIGAIANFSAAAAQLATGRWRGARDTLRQAEWSFIVPLAVGIAAAVFGLLQLVRVLIDEQPVALSSAFFGLVAMTVVMTRRQVARWNAGLALLFAAVAVAVFLAVGTRAGSVEDPSAAVLIGAGALAICAMVLPGISGAFVLVLLGLYDPVTRAVTDRDLAAIALFALGAAVGLAVFARLLRGMLSRWHDLVVAVLMGLMAGSLRVLWPWPADGEDGFESAALGAPVADDLAKAAIAAVAAAALAAILGRLGARAHPLTRDLNVS